MAAATSLLLSQSAYTPKLTVHTQVREDIFAGFMVDDLTRFEAGVAKLERMLSENPRNAPALAWRGGAELYLAVRAHEAGKSEEFRSRYAKTSELFEKALSIGPQDVGVLATTGAAVILFADRLPEDRRVEAWKKARAMFADLDKLQQPYLDRLPVHMHGELLAGLAQTAARLDKTDEAQHYLERIVKGLPGTPYESRAKKWLEQPALAKKSSIVCLTCHEPGRLENVLRSQAAPR